VSLNHLPKTRLHELVTTCFQTLTAWMWKAFMQEVIDEAQCPLADRLFPFKLMSNATTDERVTPVNTGIMWECQGATFGIAVAMTLLSLLALRLLPVPKAPPAGAGCCALQAVLFHGVATIAGALTLPLAFAWHFWTFNFAQSIVVPSMMSAGTGITSWEDFMLWVLFASILLLVALLTCGSVGSTRMLIVPRLVAARASGACPEGRHKRYEATLFKTLDFLLAWCIYAVLQSFYKDIDSTECYPEVTPHALQSASLEAIFGASLVVCASCTFLVVYKAHLGAKADVPSAALAPTAPCCRRWRGHSWTVCLGTLGIMLGWSVKDTYNAMVNVIIADFGVDAQSSAQTTTDVSIVGALIATLVFFGAYSLAFGECKRKIVEQSTKTEPTCTKPDAASAVSATSAAAESGAAAPAKAEGKV